MLKRDLYKCSLLFAPATIEEIKYFKDSLYALCVLYKNPKTNKIQMGIPGMEDRTSFQDINNFEEAKEKAYFLNLGYSDIDVAEIVNDRPVYMIDLTENKNVNAYSLVNGVNIELDDVLNGTFKVENIKSDVLTEIEKRKKFEK